MAHCQFRERWFAGATSRHWLIPILASELALAAASCDRDGSERIARAAREVGRRPAVNRTLPTGVSVRNVDTFGPGREFSSPLFAYA